MTIVINGSETQDLLDEKMQVLSEFYKAFNNKDIVSMENVWDNSEFSIMDNPVGGIKKGWNEIKDVYLKIFSSKAKVYVEFYDYTIDGTDDFYYITGKERGSFKNNELAIDLNIRTSRVFKKLDGKWVQIHHHGSIDDPELLKKYQNAIKQN